MIVICEYWREKIGTFIDELCNGKKPVRRMSIGQPGIGKMPICLCYIASTIDSREDHARILPCGSPDGQMPVIPVQTQQQSSYTSHQRHDRKDCSYRLERITSCIEDPRTRKTTCHAHRICAGPSHGRKYVGLASFTMLRDGLKRGMGFIS